MIKASESLYQPGRRGLSLMKLKRHLDTLDVVITGAEYGQGRKSQFLSDYTFAVREPAGDLLNVGKAYSGVTDVEIAELTEWCRTHTLEDFGHFRTVEPLTILEVAFNNIMRSDRHSSGFALRFRASCKSASTNRSRKSTHWSAWKKSTSRNRISPPKCPRNSCMTGIAVSSSP